MSDGEFWKIIDETCSDDLDEQLERLREALQDLDPDQLVAFDEQMSQKVSAAYRWDIWGAAYLINGGCSDDGLEYFRRWLVSRGRKIYEGALENPDSLATLRGLGEEDFLAEFEEFGYVVQEVAEENPDLPRPWISVQLPDKPGGDKWDLDDDVQIRRRLPKLAARLIK